MEIFELQKSSIQISKHQVWHQWRLFTWEALVSNMLFLLLFSFLLKEKNTKYDFCKGFIKEMLWNDPGMTLVWWKCLVWFQGERGRPGPQGPKGDSGLQVGSPAEYVLSAAWDVVLRPSRRSYSICYATTAARPLSAAADRVTDENKDPVWCFGASEGLFTLPETGLCSGTRRHLGAPLEPEIPQRSRVIF